MNPHPSASSVRVVVLAILCFSCVRSNAKDQPGQTVTWPESGAPVLRFTFGKFKEIGTFRSEHTYVTETTAENLWTKPISQATFSLYLFDKNNTRIGEGYISVNNIGKGQLVKFQTTITASGAPVSVSVSPRALPAELGQYAPHKKVSITINSIPQGASLKVDGVDTGSTPKIAQLTVGKHILQFSKDGFNPGTFPMEIGADDASGGSVSYELGASAHDTIELRDGSILSGDLLSVTATEVSVRVGGAAQQLDRNQVKRILLVERLPQ